MSRVNWFHFPNIYRPLENRYYTVFTSSLIRRKYFTFGLDFMSWCWFFLNFDSCDIYQFTNDKWTGRYPINFLTQCIAVLCTVNYMADCMTMVIYWPNKCFFNYLIFKFLSGAIYIKKHYFRHYIVCHLHKKKLTVCRDLIFTVIHFKYFLIFNIS